MLFFRIAVKRYTEVQFLATRGTQTFRGNMMFKPIAILIVAGTSAAVSGCAVTNQLHAELSYGGISTDRTALDEYGIGVLTPSAPTGQESDKQALGDVVSESLAGILPNAHVIPMSEMLSSINQAGLARPYAAMLNEYENTGILEYDTIRAVGESGAVRYLAKFNLSDFKQSSDKRLAIAGIRMFDTWRATIRVHLEIWDATTGEIAWQGDEELSFAREGVKEKPVSFSQVARLSADRLVEMIGESGQRISDEAPEMLASNNSVHPATSHPAATATSHPATATPEIRAISYSTVE